jgi:hypothetical protein
MKVGNIISNIDLEEENFNNYTTLSQIENDLPTLIIGWSVTKEIFGDKVSILHKEIEDNLFWTFSTKERKVDYEFDIDTFKRECYKKIGNHLHYVYIDILHGKYNINKKIIQKIYTLNNPISYITQNNMLYIFDENIVFGVDLNICELIGITNTKIIERITSLPNSILLGNEIFNKCKDLIKKIDNKERILPYVYKNGKYN